MRNYMRCRIYNLGRRRIYKQQVRCRIDVHTHIRIDGCLKRLEEKILSILYFKNLFQSMTPIEIELEIDHPYVRRSYVVQHPASAFFSEEDDGVSSAEADWIGDQIDLTAYHVANFDIRNEVYSWIPLPKSMYD